MSPPSCCLSLVASAVTSPLTIDGPAAELLSGVTTLGRYGGAEDIAAAVAHLAGDGGRYISGTAVTVDGGFAA
jgi:3-oxoacyl-[acyl-carrier protein] reductase